MKFKLHQLSWVNGALIGPDEPNKGEVEISPLAQKGEEITHRVAGKRPKRMRLTEDLYPVPGPHWEPLDDEAKALCLKHNHEFTGEIPDVLSGLEEQLAEAQAQRLHPDSGAQLAEGIVNALIAAGAIQKPANPQQPARK